MYFTEITGSLRSVYHIPVAWLSSTMPALITIAPLPVAISTLATSINGLYAYAVANATTPLSPVLVAQDANNPLQHGEVALSVPAGSSVTPMQLCNRLVGLD